MGSPGETVERKKSEEETETGAREEEEEVCECCPFVTRAEGQMQKNVEGRWGGFHDNKMQDEKVLSRRYYRGTARRSLQATALLASSRCANRLLASM